MVSLTNRTRQSSIRHPEDHVPNWVRLRQTITKRLLPAFWTSHSREVRPARSAAIARPFRTRCAWKSAAGNYRATNQDRCFGNSATGVFLVADGMGGYSGGAHASRIIVDTMPPFLAQATSQPDPRADTIQRAVEDAVHAARLEMNRFAERHPDCNRMGATLALLAIAGGYAFFTHVGDSRVYLIRRNAVQRLTTDETFVQVLVRAGVISEDEARTHPKRHFVLNHIGVKPMDHPPEVSRFPLEPGDRIVLTTDGVTDVIDDDMLCRLVVNQKSAAEVADAIIETALHLDSKDNVSCVVVESIAADEKVPQHAEPILSLRPLAA